MKQTINKSLFIVVVMMSLLLYACATAKSAKASKKPVVGADEKPESSSSDDSVEKDDDAVEEKSDIKEVDPSKGEKALNVRKISETEKQARESRFDGTLYIGDGKKEFEKGLEFYFQTDCKSAISHWKNGLEDDKYAAPIAFNIALCLAREGKFKDAEKWYIKSFKIDNNYISPLYNLFLLKNRDKKVSLGEFESFASQISDALHRYNFLAWIYYQLKRYSQSEDNARKALKIDEQNNDAVVILASVYFKKGMLELANGALQTAEKWNENDFRLQRLYGFVLYKLGNSAAAITHLQKAKQLNPELPAVLNLLAVLSFEIEDWDSAKQNLEFLLDFYPRFAPAKINLAIVYKELKNYKKSLSLLQELAKIEQLSKDEQYTVYYNLGILHLDADIEQTQNPKRFDVASGYFEKALSLLKGKKGVRKKRKALVAYMKEAKTEKRKLEIYLKAKIKREKRRKEREEEARKYVELRKVKFSEAQKTDTLEGWRFFLETYPSDSGEDEIEKQARARMGQLDATAKQEEAEKQAVLSARKNAYDLAKKSDNLTLWHQFLKDFPSPNEKDDSLTTTAKIRIDFLQKQIEKREHEIEQYQKDRTVAFEKVKKNETLAGWKNFLQTFPPHAQGSSDEMSLFANKRAIALHSQMEEEKKKEKEYAENRRKIFGVAKQQGSIVAWRDFLKSFPPYKGGDDVMTYYATMQITTIQKQAQDKKNAIYLEERSAAFQAVKQIDDPNVYMQFSRDFPPLDGKDDKISRYVKKRMQQLEKKK